MLRKIIRALMVFTSKMSSRVRSDRESESNDEINVTSARKPDVEAEFDVDLGTELGIEPERGSCHVFCIPTEMGENGRPQFDSESLKLALIAEAIGTDDPDLISQELKRRQLVAYIRALTPNSGDRCIIPAEDIPFLELRFHWVDNIVPLPGYVILDDGSVVVDCDMTGN